MHIPKKSLGAAIAGLWYGPVASAAFDAADKAAQKGVATDFAGVGQVVFGLIMVLAVIAALAFFVRRMGRFPYGGSGPVQILGGVNVGQRERIVVIRAGGRQLLVGVTPNSINTLLVSDQDIVPEEGVRTRADHPDGFKAQLQNALERLKGR